MARLLLGFSVFAFTFYILNPLAGFNIFRDFHSGATELIRVDTLDELTLRHVLHHGAGQSGPRARRLDVTPERITQADAASQIGPFPFRTSAIIIERPALKSRSARNAMSPIWIADDVQAPDVEDKSTIISMASMSENAYRPGSDDSGWMDIDGKYNSSLPFGWEDSGIRGHVFTDNSNSTVILALKGTSIAIYERNGTSVRDKDNDNLFGSCCCAQGGSYLWRQVCDCQTSTYTCDDKCVREELRKPNRYYAATLELYEEVLQLYPNANVVTTGHSLGGVLASLIGLQHGIPAVTFEAYPQAMAAKRLGLPTAGDVAPLRKNTGGFHFGHTADPIYMGTCNGPSSFCSIAGYGLETICHTGKRCAYDVVKDWGWRQSTSTHTLRYAIDNVYQKYEKAATCIDEAVDCVDCFLWKYEEGTHTKPTTTTVATSTVLSSTRTETCKTPGWWGCKDVTTTDHASTTSTSTTSTSISTSIITSSITSISITSTSTSTCETPGWFGCKDKTTTTTSTSSTSSPTSTCKSKNWVGRCRDEVPAKTTPAAEEFAYWRIAPTVTQTYA